MPLASKWWLSTKKNNETWVEPHVHAESGRPVIHFTVQTGKGKPLDGTVNRQGATCIACNSAVPFEYVRSEGRAGRMSAQLIATVAEGKKGRVYLASDESQEQLINHLAPSNVPDTSLPERALSFRVQVYGMTKHRDLFTPRQLIALTTFSDLIEQVREKMLCDLVASSAHSSTHAEAYANAIVTCLAIAIDKCADYWSNICSWHTTRETITHVFARQAIPMTWDFVEVNPFSNSSGNFLGMLKWVAESLENAPYDVIGQATQRDAVTAINDIEAPLISTDPPYYDNVGYADLSDFFYVWLRRSLGNIYPELFRTLLVPKAQELVATPYRFNGSKREAQQFFETGLRQAFEQMRCVQHPDYPLTVYYAFKQAEADLLDDEQEGKTASFKKQAIASTGWETMLEGLIGSGFTITGTWPMRTEMMNRSVGQGTNALASSIVLVCRPRPAEAPIASRRQFINELRGELTEALRMLQHGGIAPVDLAQASIGPGMAIYSRYSRVIESDGSTLAVRTALQLINRELDSILAAQEGEYDAETRWAVAWYEECGLEEGPYGRAELLSKAKNASLQALVEAGILDSRAGKVRLLRRDEYTSVLQADTRREPSIWEVLQRMLHALDKDGEEGAGNVLGAVPVAYGEIVRDLAYRLYTVCERKGRTQEALYYNMLITSWEGIGGQARSVASGKAAPQQTTLF